MSFSSEYQRNDFHQEQIRERFIRTPDKLLARVTAVHVVQHRLIAAVYGRGNEIWLGVSIIIRRAP